MPGDPPPTPPPSSCPFERAGAQLFVPDFQSVMLHIAPHHREVVVLAAVVEPQPQAEAVREGHLLLDRLMRADRGGALVLHHVARQEMAAVGGRIEKEV